MGMLRSGREPYGEAGIGCFTLKTTVMAAGSSRVVLVNALGQEGLEVGSIAGADRDRSH